MTCHRDTHFPRETKKSLLTSKDGLAVGPQALCHHRALEEQLPTLQMHWGPPAAYTLQNHVMSEY